ncbi:hypothetical protein V6N13_073490 [Hibiscus sabdariffa]
MGIARSIDGTIVGRRYASAAGGCSKHSSSLACSFIAWGRIVTKTWVDSSPHSCGSGLRNTGSAHIVGSSAARICPVHSKLRVGPWVLSVSLELVAPREEGTARPVSEILVAQGQT